MADLKENVIEWLNGQDIISVTFHQGRLITRIERLAKKFPDQVKILHRNADGSIFAKLPLKSLHISLSSRGEMSEEQRQKVAERFAKSRKAKVQEEEEWDDEEWE